MLLKKTDRQLLFQLSLFKDLPDEEFDLISSEIKVVDIKRSEIVKEKGTYGDGLYIIADGTLQVYLPSKGSASMKAGEINLAKLDRGAFFGEYSLVDGKKTSASIRALTKGRLLFLSSLDFETVVEENHLLGKILYRNLLFSMVERLRKSNQELDIMVYGN